MVDARLPSRWLIDPRMEDLSDRAWRTYMGALMFSNEAGTDGHVPQRSLRLLHPFGVDSATLAELVNAKLLEPAGSGVQVCDWEQQGQSLAADVTAKRESNRERQRKHRSKVKALPVTGDVTRDVTRESLRTGEEQERTGQASNGEPASEWPVAEIGKGRVAS